jgi:hypothetical protein
MLLDSFKETFPVFKKENPFQKFLSTCSLTLLNETTFPNLRTHLGEISFKLLLELDLCQIIVFLAFQWLGFLFSLPLSPIFSVLAIDEWEYGFPYFSKKTLENFLS